MAQDVPEAVKLLTHASYRGDPRYVNILGYLYGTGSGVPRDLVTSYMWYSIGQIVYPAGPERQDTFENLQKVRAAMTAEQIKEGDKRVLDWRRRQ